MKVSFWVASFETWESVKKWSAGAYVCCNSRRLCKWPDTHIFQHQIFRAESSKIDIFFPSETKDTKIRRLHVESDFYIHLREDIILWKKLHFLRGLPAIFVNATVHVIFFLCVLPTKNI